VAARSGKEIIVKRLLALVCAATTAVTIAGFGQAQAAPSTPTVAAVASFTPSVGSWAACADPNLAGLECSTLTVPLDYSHPDDGRTVHLAITRLAADPLAGPYAGIMVLNPGGPGGAGTPYPVLRNYVPGTAAKRYDWVGFDPRGVGASTPALHCNPHYFGPNRPDFRPRTRALLRYWVHKSARYAKACATSSARALLPFMTTRDTVRDMESLRQALHDALPVFSPKRAQLDKLNFYGFSYGTYLGTVYATLYPAKVGRFVLDGVVDPARFWYKSNFDQSIAFDRNINIFFRWMAKHHKVFHLGTSGRAIRRDFNHQLRKLDRHPSAGGRLGPDELTDAMLSAGYYVYDWDSIGAAFAKLVRKGRGGDLYKMYADGNQGVDADNGYAVYNAVQCTDQRRPPLAQQLADTRRVNRKAPFLAWDNTWFNGPCLTWAAPSRGKVHVSGSALDALGTKILLISETKDAATPFAGALHVRGAFGGARLIAGVGGTTHAGSLSGVACVDNRIAQYLATGAVPARRAGRRADVSCPHVPPPPAAGSSARIAGRSGMPASLRNALMGAQRFGY
jgi:pimeloyl-ACP methyl ester carboxylesterase